MRSGLGKPSLHISVDLGVEFSCGIETTAQVDPQHHKTCNVLKEEKESFDGRTCFCMNGDIRENFTFDPFTHVCIFNILFSLSHSLHLYETFFIMAVHPLK